MLKVVYMGTPEFAVSPLDKIAKAFEVGYVVTQEDKPKNRGKKMLPTPVKEKAEELGISVLQPHRVRGNDELLKTLSEYEPDVIVVAAYGQILPIEVLELPKYGCINIHASLLPRHRGAAPVQKVILDGDEYAGVTIMMMEEGLDTGDMILSDRTSTSGKTAGTLTGELSVMGAELIVKVLDMLDRGEDIPRVKQNDDMSTYAGMISKKDGMIDWKCDCEYIERQIRAMDPWPGAYTDFNGVNLKIWESEYIICEGDEIPGTVLRTSDDGIEIKAGNGYVIAKLIQMPGKNKVRVRDFLRGNTIEEGTVLG